MNVTLVRSRLAIFRRYRHTLTVMMSLEQDASVLDWIDQNLVGKARIVRQPALSLGHYINQGGSHTTRNHVIEFTHSTDATAFMLTFSEFIKE